MIPPHIDAIFNEYLGKRNLAIADLQLFLHSPVGVGDHQNFGGSIKSKLKEIDKFDSLVKIIIELYPEVNRTPKPDPAPPPEVSKPSAVDERTTPEEHWPQAATSETDLYKDGESLGSFKNKQE
jgi:hypothetical protein